MRIVFDIDSFGITQKSLKNLRDALHQYASIYGDILAIVEAPTSNINAVFLFFTMVVQIR
jgi:hypothetical protein